MLTKKKLGMQKRKVRKVEEGKVWNVKEEKVRNVNEGRVWNAEKEN